MRERTVCMCVLMLWVKMVVNAVAVRPVPSGGGIELGVGDSCWVGVVSGVTERMFFLCHEDEGIEYGSAILELTVLCYRPGWIEKQNENIIAIASVWWN